MTDDRRVFLAPFAHPLAGRWVDACDAEEELERLQERWGDTDFGAMDSEGFGGVVNEHTSVDDIVAWDEALEEQGDPLLAFLKVEGVYGASVAEVVERFQDAYAGQYDSPRDFAEEVVESCGYLDEMPESLRPYFNYDAFGRDLMFDHYEQDGYYFRSC